MHTLIERDEKIYVEYYNVLWSEPMVIKNYYRVTVMDHGDMFGAALNQPMNFRNGIFESRVCSFCCGVESLPEITVEEPIRKPRGRNVRWYEGEWQRYTAKKGWTYAG